MGRNKKINYWLLAIGLVVVVFLVFGGKEEKPLQSIGQSTTKPFARFFSGAGFWFSEKFSFFSNIGKMKIENEKLFDENLKLKFELAKLKDIESENKVLRNELDLMDRKDFETRASLVIGKTLSKNRKIIYLDKGQNDGIKEGDPVIVSGGILVGKISKIYSSSSEAELILDNNNKVNAEVQEAGIKGIVQGEYGTSAVMDMIPQSAKIEKGQTIITSGLGGLFPRGLLIGYIKETGLTVDQLFQKASLDLPIQFNNLRMVWVITN